MNIFLYLDKTTWVHRLDPRTKTTFADTLIMKPVNPDFEPIILTGADDGQLQVIAEMVEVLRDAQNGYRTRCTSTSAWSHPLVILGKRGPTRYSLGIRYEKNAMVVPWG